VLLTRGVVRHQLDHDTKLGRDISFADQ
jgi:hypothetical protein